jgi:hypothetical protein
MKKVFVSLVAALAVLAGGMFASVQATALPWLDIGGTYNWDGVNTFTDAGNLTYVSKIKYMDGTVIPKPPINATQPDIYGEMVTFSISYDGVSNDWIKIGGGTYLSAELDVKGTINVPLQNNYAGV